MSGHITEEAQPLLQDEDSASLPENKKPNLLHRLFPPGFKDEAKAVGKHLPALIVCQVCQWFVQPIAVIFGGHLGKVELDAVGLSCSLINVFGASIIWGTSAACDIAFSHTYGGKNKKMVGIYLQRCLIVLMLTLLPCYAFHINAEGLLLLLGQNPEVSRLCGRYMLIFLPGMMCLFLNMILQKYCICLKIVNHDIWMGLVAHAFHAVLQYVFLYQLDMGIDGSALAQVCFYILTVMMRIPLLLCSKDARECWGGWTLQCFQGWGALFKLALAGGINICAEWWSHEISTILSGLLGTAQLGAQTVIFNIFTIINSFHNGIGSAAIIHMGHHLGAGDPKSTKTSSKVVFMYAVINGLFWLVLLLIFSKDVGRIFTGEQDVLDIISDITPVTACYVSIDALTVLGRLIFRVASKQKISVIIILITYYVCSMPVGYSLMLLTDLELFGLWLGFALCSVLTATIMTVGWIFFFDWTKISKEAQIRGYAHLEESVYLVDEDAVNGKTCLSRESYGSVNSLVDNSITKDDKSSPMFNNCEKSIELNDEPKDVTRAEILKCIFIIAAFFFVLFIGIVIKLSTQDLIDQFYIDISKNVTNPDFDNVTHVVQLVASQ